MSLNYFDMKNANISVNKACGQLVTIPNGAINQDELTPMISIDEVNLGSVWLAKDTGGKTYAVSASHCVDNNDAYLNSYNIIGKHTNVSSDDIYIVKSLKNQTHLYLMSSSPNIYVDLYISNSESNVVFVLGENFGSLLYTGINVNSPRDNILGGMFGLSANTYNTETELNASDYRVEWSKIDETGFISGVDISDTANNQFCIGKIDLTSIDDAKYVSYKYGNNTDNGQLLLLTSGQKESRWIRNIYSDNDNATSPESCLNYGLIMATFPNSALGNKPVQLQVIGGDHRADIVIMRPNFDYIDMGITPVEWDSLSGLHIDDNKNICTGELIGTIGNPEFVAQSSLNAGFVRNPRSAETSYCPSEPILTSIVPLHGMSGSPMFSRYGKVAGLFTYGIGSLTANISGGPNTNILSKVFNYVTSSFRSSNSFEQIDMVKYYIGADFYNLSVDYILDLLNLFNNRYDVQGLVIDSIDETGPLGMAGLNVGDIITSVSYAKTSKPSEQVTVKLGNGVEEKNIFSILYNTDIYLGRVNITYISGNTYDVLTTGNILLGSYVDNLHADYYFGDTSYKLKKSVVETKNTTSTQYVNRTERINDMFINKLTVKSNKQIKINNSKIQQKFKLNVKNIEKFKAMIDLKSKKFIKKTK